MSELAGKQIDKAKMNILVISTTQWSDTVATGNTFSNFFGNWQDANFLNLYLRAELPQNSICNGYYNITEKQILKNFFNPGGIGQTFSKEQSQEMRAEKDISNSVNQERKVQKIFLSIGGSIFLLAIELLWKTGGWKNGKLDKFLNQDIDIIFAPGANTIHLNSVIDYCVKKTGAKLILFFGDDVYCHRTKMPLSYIMKTVLRREIRKSVKNGEKIYGASQKLCNEYEKYFGEKIEPLYKGCTLEQYRVKNTVANPVKIVYAGNLFYKRWKTLEVLAGEIEKINGDLPKITLEIFTTAEITPELDKALNRGTASRMMGARPYEEIKNILAGADIVLHVESFDKKQIKKTRLSFSTKIIDGMQSGSCMMAIGPDCVASIEYLKKLDCAIVITDLTKTGEALKDIAQNPEGITARAAMLRRYAKEHHDIKTVREKLQNDFEILIASKNKANHNR